MYFQYIFKLFYNFDLKTSKDSNGLNRYRGVYCETPVNPCVETPSLCLNEAMCHLMSAGEYYCKVFFSC
jgi:hypothetical protein